MSQNPDQNPEQPEDRSSDHSENVENTQNNSGSHSSDARWEDEQGQPRYGVRLPEDQRQQFQAPQTPQTPQPYGRFTPHEQTPGSEYGAPPADQQSPYGQYPNQYPNYGPQGWTPPQQSMPRPSKVKLASRLIMIAGAIYVVLNVITAFLPNMGVPQQMWDEVSTVFEESGMAVDLDSMMTQMRIAVVIFSLLFGFIYWVIARGVAKGSNAARITGLVLAIISLPQILGISAAYVIVGAVGIGLAFTSESNEYFRYKAWEKVSKFRQ